MLLQAAAMGPRKSTHTVRYTVGGAAPPAALLEKMEQLNFRITHGYGLTESYGPSVVCEWKAEWDALPLQERALHLARQGIQTYGINEVMVADLQTLEPVPADGATIGEILLKGATVMKGYHRDAAATEAAFADGWLHTGDLAVLHRDGYIEVKDRSKDIIISGGENISSLEVESVLYRHPAVLEAAVVARPDPKWGEVPCAFVALRPDATAAESDLIDFCRNSLARFKVPKAVVFGPLPKTSTGKIQKHLLRTQAKSAP
jgi:fatty-acyl-CoA synthase